jgi:hypothetical protein
MNMKLGSLTLREEHILMVFENRVLSRIFRPKRDEVSRGWRNVYNEELRNLYPTPNILLLSLTSTVQSWTFASSYFLVP